MLRTHTAEGMRSVSAGIPRRGETLRLGKALFVIPRLVLLVPLRFEDLRVRQLLVRQRTGLRIFTRRMLEGDRSATCPHERDDQHGHGDQGDEEPRDHVRSLSGPERRRDTTLRPEDCGRCRNGWREYGHASVGRTT